MTNRTATTTAIILSLAAAGAPAASARPVDYAPVGKQAPVGVYDRADKQMIAVTPSAASGDAIGPASAVRSSAQDQRVRGLSAYREGQLATSFDVAAAAANRASAPRAVVRVNAVPSGFDWGDAGIGAAGLALSASGVLGAFAVFQRRSRRARALPS